MKGKELNKQIAKEVRDYMFALLDECKKRGLSSVIVLVARTIQEGGKNGNYK